MNIPINAASVKADAAASSDGEVAVWRADSDVASGDADARGEVEGDGASAYNAAGAVTRAQESARG